MITQVSSDPSFANDSAVFQCVIWQIRRRVNCAAAPYTACFFWVRCSVDANLSGCMQHRMRGFTVLVFKGKPVNRVQWTIRTAGSANEFMVHWIKYKVAYPNRSFSLREPLSSPCRFHGLVTKSRDVACFLQIRRLFFKIGGSHSSGIVMWPAVVKNKPGNDRFLCLSPASGRRFFIVCILERQSLTGLSKKNLRR